MAGKTDNGRFPVWRERLKEDNGSRTIVCKLSKEEREGLKEDNKPRIIDCKLSKEWREGLQEERKRLKEDNERRIIVLQGGPRGSRRFDDGGQAAWIWRRIILHWPVGHVTDGVVMKACTGKLIRRLNTGEGRRWTGSTIRLLGKAEGVKR